MNTALLPNVLKSTEAVQQITEASSAHLAAVAQWSQEARFNYDQLNRTNLQINTDLKQITSAFNSLPTNNENLVNVLATAEKEVQDLKAELMRVSTVNNLDEQRKMYDILSRRVNTVVSSVVKFVNIMNKAANDASAAQAQLNMLTQKATQNDKRSKFRIVSNYSIFEEYDALISSGKVSNDIKQMWNILESSIYHIFDKYNDKLPELNRIVNGELAHGKTLAANQSFLYQNKPLELVKEFEYALGRILERFWSIASTYLCSSNQEIFKKYQPPFTQSRQVKIGNSLSSELLPKENAQRYRMILVKGPSEYSEPDLVLNTGSSDFCIYENDAAAASGSGCPCAIKIQVKDNAYTSNPYDDKSPSSFTNALQTGLKRSSLLGSSESDEDEISKGCYLLAAEGAKKRMRRKRQRRISCMARGGGNEMMLCDDGDDTVGERFIYGTGLNNFYGGRESSPTKSASSSSSSLKPVEMFNILTQQVDQALSMLKGSKTQKGVDYTATNISSITGALQTLMALRRVYVPALNFATHQQMLDTFSSYTNIIQFNTEISPSRKMISQAAYDLLKKLLDEGAELTKTIGAQNAAPNTDVDTAIKNNHVLLPPLLMNTTRSDLLSALNMLETQTELITDSLIAESRFANPDTVLSIGLVNEDGAGFDTQEEQQRLVKFNLAHHRDPLNAYLVQFKDGSGLKKAQETKNTLEKVLGDIKQELNQVDGLLKQVFNFVQDTEALDKEVRTKLADWLKHITSNLSFCASAEHYENLPVWNEIKNLKGAEAVITKLLKDQSVQEFVNSKDGLLIANQFKPMIGCTLRLLFSKFPFTSAALKEKLELLFGALDLLRKNKAYLKMNVRGDYSAFFDINLEPLESAIKYNTNLVQRIEQLQLEDFEKRFSTPVVRDKTMYQAFVEQGLQILYRKNQSMTLYMLGPSGSGKSYNQYGDPTRISMSDTKFFGIDQFILGMENRKNVTFRDTYAMCFPFEESLIQAIAEPQRVYYYFEDKILKASPSSQTVDVSQLSKSYYFEQIKPKRVELDYIRATQQNPDSSRAFFSLMLETTTGELKTMVDSPGYELVDDQCVVNPFVSIFAKIFPLVGPIDRDEKTWRASVEKTITDACGLSISFATCEADIIPLPNENGDYYSLGIQSNTTFRHFIDSAHHVVPRTKPGTREVCIDLLAKVYDYRIEGKGWVRDGMPQEVAESIQHEFDQIQNIVIDRKLAYCYFYTWCVYKAIFNSPTTTSSTGAASNTSSYVDKMRKYINFINIPGAQKSLEAVFMNQFNYWARHSTSKAENYTLETYLATVQQPAQQQQQQQQKTATMTLGKAFYDFMIFFSDVKLPINYDARLPRLAYHETTVHNYRYLYSLESQKKILYFFVGADTMSLPTMLDYYKSFNVFYKDQILHAAKTHFDRFITSKPSKNLFITILNSTCKPERCPYTRYIGFFDLSRTKLEEKNKQENAVKNEK